MQLSSLPPCAVTHAGKFHADDVFSGALLHILRPGIGITRVFQVPDGFDGLAFDVGWGSFDHHQKGAPVRENGVPYAAFGLLWRAFGAQLLMRGCSAEDAAREAGHFDEVFVQPLDLDDNTGCGSDVASVIAPSTPPGTPPCPQMSNISRPLPLPRSFCAISLRKSGPSAGPPELCGKR